MSGVEITRRDFLKLSGVALGGSVLRACGVVGDPTPRPENILLGEELAKMLEITNLTTRTEMASIAARRMYGFSVDGLTEDKDYSSWNTDTDKVIGTFYNGSGQTLPLKLDADGEPNIPVIENIILSYPEPDKYRFERIDMGTNITVVIYGTLVTLGNIKVGKQVIADFAKEYFKDSKAPLNVLHLNFNSPFYPQMRYENIGDLEKDSPDKIKFSTGAAGTFRDVSQAIKRESIFINLNPVGDASLSFGLSKEDLTREALANEISGALGNHYSPLQARDRKANEAYTTLAGFAGIWNENTRNLVLGGSAHLAFVDMLVKEMDRLEDIAREISLASTRKIVEPHNPDLVERFFSFVAGETRPVPA